MNYTRTRLREELRITQIITIHYYEYMSDFMFEGESHDFWEFLCVDKGELEVTANQEKTILKKGDIIFHKPNEFHALAANGVIAPNLVVISFDCDSPPMRFFEDQILSIGAGERALIAQIIAEARSNFSNRLDNPYLEQLTRKESPPFGCEQMIKIHLEQLLIQLYRNFTLMQKPYPEANDVPDSDRIYASIIAYFEHQIRTQLTVDLICRENLIGVSQLKRLFREKHHTGVIECFIQLKMDYAKQLIRNRQMNYTQIADYLGYTSVHYFSRQFKKETGMTPTEYSASIKQLSEGYSPIP
ncbi:MAG: helix-turn-helix domain-containing protein [Hungatella sp.]